MKAQGAGAVLREHAVEHERVAQRRDVGFAQQGPDAELAQQFGAVLGERDFAAIESGLLQRVAGVLFDQADVQSAAAQRPGQAQAGRAASWRSTSWAAASEEAGFCPVIRLASLTT